jgi:hypothetical protein
MGTTPKGLNIFAEKRVNSSLIPTLFVIEPILFRRFAITPDAPNEKVRVKPQMRRNLLFSPKQIDIFTV